MIMINMIRICHYKFNFFDLEIYKFIKHPICLNDKKILVIVIVLVLVIVLIDTFNDSGANPASAMNNMMTIAACIACIHANHTRAFTITTGLMFLCTNDIIYVV